MTVADKHAGPPAADAPPPLWRDPAWLGVVALLVIIGAALIGAIAGRNAATIDLWALVVGAGAVAAGAAASLAVFAGRAAAPERRSGKAARELLRAMPSAGAVIDRSGRAAAANEQFHKLFPDADHAPLAALKGRIDADAAAEIVDRLADAVAAGAATREHVRVADSGDGIEWLCVSAMPLADPAGAALWTFEDVTAERTAQAASGENSALLAELVDSAPAGFFSVDADGSFLLVNPALAQWLGYAPGAIEAQGLHLHDIVVAPPAHTPPHRVAGETADDTGEQLVQMLGQDGALLRVAVAQAETRDGAGVLRSSGVVRRIVQRPAPAAEPVAGALRFERLFERAPVGVVVLDAKGRLVQSNPAWRSLVAAGAGDPAGRPIAEFVAESAADTLAAWLERAGADDAAPPPQDVTLRTTTPAGAPRVATMYTARLDGGPDSPPDGAAGELIVYFHDVTEQRNLETQFVQGQKMQAVGQLAGGVAHDFNNLLTAMIGFCDLLLLRHTPGDQSFGDIMQIKQNANRAARLVRQLLAFSRQQTLQPRVLSITDVLGDLTNLLRRLIGANIDLEISHGRDLGPVRVDQGQLEQVVINLAVNARDAMPDGGALSIRTYNESVVVETRRGSEVIAPGEYVAIEIADTGGGIASEHLERIFEPFFTTKEVGAGTGLGLSTVYGIVKQTGGQIFVDSTVGKGTKFTIIIPRHEIDTAEVARKAETPEGPAAAETTGAGTVLLVEDEDAVRLFSARALRAKGYKVLEARTGEAALELVGAVDDFIDLMITDAVMPEMDGPTLIKEMRASRPDLRIICISGYAEETFREKLGQSDDIHFLPKPFSLDQLAGKVKDVMSGPAP